MEKVYSDDIENTRIASWYVSWGSKDYIDVQKHQEFNKGMITQGKKLQEATEPILTHFID